MSLRASGIMHSSKSIELTTYGITVKELQELMSHQGQKGVEILKNYGGIGKVIEKLITSPEYGIIDNPTNIEKRRVLFGRNSIDPPKSKSFFALMLIALNDPILIFLEIGGIFSLSVALFEKLYSDHEVTNYEWVEGVAIIVSVLIIVLVTASTDYQKEKQFRNLQDQLKEEHKVPVLRNGEINEISIKDLVVGDICLIKYGNAIPADGIIIQSNDLKIDESALTGESDLVLKGIDIDVMVLSGTYVMEGSGKILITAVGINSQNGIILTLLGFGGPQKKDNINNKEKEKEKRASETIATLRETKRTKSNLETNEEMQQVIDVGKTKSILQIKLVKLAYNVSKVALVIASLLVIALIAKFIYSFIKEKKTWNSECVREIINHIITSISILVIAIPEGLALAVTLALAYSVKKMTYDNNLVRNLAACETMGNATTICSDKTGTLTTNRMTTVQLYTCEKLYKKIPNIERIPKLCYELFIQGVSVNSLYTSRITIPENKLHQVEQIGNKTECALLGLVNDLGSNYELIRMQYPENEFIHIYTFNSVRKSMSTVIKINDYIYRLYTKGASEIIMLKCRYVFTIDGKIEEFTDDMKSNLNSKVITPMAKDGLRTITIAYRDFLSRNPVQLNETYTDINNINWEDENFIVNDLTLLCVCGIEDPVRPEVPKAIHLCQLAGITVRMVTGDNIVTARSIANKCGILNENDNKYLIMEGSEFNKRVFDENGKFNQRKFDKIWPKLRVLARSTPIDKYVLVKGIIDSKISTNREVVAVTGDGTNDGPALKVADVGFAMGIAGTDVAKEAADIIITDDNFSSIVKAVMWGRNIYDSIAKFIQFQLTVNLVAVIIAVSSALYSNYSALKAVQLLWVNLIMDSLASLALATEKPTEKILSRKPYGRTKSIISGQMFVNIFCQAIYQLAVLYSMLFYFHILLNIPNGDSSAEPTTHYTLIFNTLVVMTLFNEINSRKLHREINIFDGLFQNYIFLLIWLTTFTIQIIIVQKGSYVFHTKSLSFKEWMLCIFFGIFTIIWSLIYNRVPIILYAQTIYYSCCPPRELDLEVADENDKDKSSWIRSSKRLSRQLSVIRRLSTRIENETNRFLKKETALAKPSSNNNENSPSTR